MLGTSLVWQWRAAGSAIVAFASAGDGAGGGAASASNNTVVWTIMCGASWASVAHSL